MILVNRHTKPQLSHPILDFPTLLALFIDPIAIAIHPVSKYNSCSPIMAHFETFSKQFKGDLITPSHPEYQQSLDRWAANSRRNAAVVAFVKDSEDVSLAIKYAREANLRIAIRGGGHSAAGTSSCEGGLVVDLSRYLNNVRVDAEKKLIYVQGGASWKTVDHASIKHGLAGVAGTVNHVSHNSSCSCKAMLT